MRMLEALLGVLQISFILAVQLMISLTWIF